MPRYFFLLLLSTAILLPAAPRIWFIHDLAKINPQTGGAYEAGNLYSTHLPADYQDKNSAWDAGAKTVSLKGLRDEVVAFQAVVVSDAPLSVEEIKLSDLKGPGIIPGRTQITLYREWFLKDTQPSWDNGHLIFPYGKGWYPSQLIPLDAPDLKPEFGFPSRLPCSQNRVTGQKALAFWIDVHIPSSAKAGKYEGKMEMRVDGKTQAYALRLTVGREVLPPENHSNFMAISMFMKVISVTHPEWIRDINFLFHSHRQDFVPYNYYPATEGTGKALKVIWDRYTPNDSMPHLGDANFVRDFLPYLRAETYTEKNGYFGPAQNSAPLWVTLPLQVGWFKRKGIDYGSPAYAETFKAACKQVHDKFNEWGIKQKRIAFINKADEPHDFKTLELGKVHTDLFTECKKEFNMEYLNRMDIGGISSWWCAHKFNPAWNAESLLVYFRGGVDIWNINPSPGAFSPDPMKFVEFRRRYPSQYWIYATQTSGEPSIGNHEIDCENIGILTWTWAMYKYRVEGGMFWEGFLWNRDLNKAWNDPLQSTHEQSTEGMMNGDASCLYPGEYVLKNARPIPGIRLKLIRRANQDFEYFRLLEQKSGGKVLSDSLITSVLQKALWDAEFDWTEAQWDMHEKGTLFPDKPNFSYMHGAWSHNPEEWVQARYKVFDLLERK